MVLVRPEMCPEMTATAPNSPMARPLQSRIPYSNPHLMLGIVTRMSVCHPLAPSKKAASSWAVPCFCIKGMSSRATKGRVTNSVATITPGTANAIWMPCVASHGPSSPCIPNSNTNSMPPITGEIENGRSIRVMSRFFPGYSNFVIAHAAAMPKAALSGRMRNSARNARATAISPVRAAGDSVSGSETRARCALRRSTCAAAARSATLPPPRPRLEKIDREQQNERGDQHQAREHGGAGVIELLELDHDEQWQDFGNSGHVAGDEDHRAVLADGAREGERRARDQRRQQRWKHHAPQDGRARGAQQRCRLLKLVIEILQHRLDRAHHERQPDENQGDENAERRECESGNDAAFAHRGEREGDHGSSAPRPIDLVEQGAVGEMRPLYLGPAAELVNLHEFEVGKSIFVVFAHLRQSRTEIEASRELLRLRRIQKGEIRFRRFPGAMLVDDLIDYGDRRLGQNADRGYHQFELARVDLVGGEQRLVFPCD